MVLFICTLSIYLIKLKRRQRFELTIIVYMLLKYMTHLLDHLLTPIQIEIPVIIWAISSSCGPVCHMIYAS